MEKYVKSSFDCIYFLLLQGHAVYAPLVLLDTPALMVHVCRPALLLLVPGQRSAWIITVLIPAPKSSAPIPQNVWTVPARVA